MFFLENDAWEARETKTKGRGIFTMKEIAPGMVIGDYLGKVLDNAATEAIYDKENFYLMYYHDRASVFPDLTKPGIHLLNHSCTPNVWMYTYHGHTLFFSLRHIFSGEELTVSYLLSPQKDCAECTHFCICGAKLCNGTMHMSVHRYDLWSRHHEEESGKSKPIRVRFGQTLPKLPNYPEHIQDNNLYLLFGAADQEPLTRDDTVMPDMKTLREVIRTTGRIIEFPNLRLRVLGVTEDLVYSESI